MRLNYAIASALRVALAASLFPPTLPGRSIAQTSTRDTTHVPSYRLRVLGLFDQTTGEPIEGAEIFDVGSGWSAKTTATGTVSLVFLPDGGGLVRIRKVGYAPLFTKIAISPADTAPITLLLAQVTELPAVITKDSARHFRFRQFERIRGASSAQGGGLLHHRHAASQVGESHDGESHSVAVPRRRPASQGGRVLRHDHRLRCLAGWRAREFCRRPGAYGSWQRADPAAIVQLELDSDLRVAGSRVLSERRIGSSGVRANERSGTAY